MCLWVVIELKIARTKMTHERFPLDWFYWTYKSIDVNSNASLAYSNKANQTRVHYWNFSHVPCVNHLPFFCVNFIINLFLWNEDNNFDYLLVVSSWKCYTMPCRYRFQHGEQLRDNEPRIAWVIFTHFDSVHFKYTIFSRQLNSSQNNNDKRKNNHNDHSTSHVLCSPGNKFRDSLCVCLCIPNNENVSKNTKINKKRWMSIYAQRDKPTTTRTQNQQMFFWVNEWTSDANAMKMLF